MLTTLSYPQPWRGLYFPPEHQPEFYLLLKSSSFSTLGLRATPKVDGLFTKAGGVP